MTIVSLFTRDLKHVKDVFILPFKTPPDVLQWGTRVFQRDVRSKLLRYRECFAAEAYD